MSIFNEIGALDLAEDCLAFLAHHDPLTGLPNRLLLRERLAHALQRRDCLCAIIFLDLDNFKLVNDRLGHAEGDILLQTVAARIPEVLCKSDTVARFGDAELVVSIENSMHRSALLRVCDAIQKALQSPVNVLGQRLEISASLGVAIAPRHGQNPHHLLQAADTAGIAPRRPARARFAFTSAKRLGSSPNCFVARTKCDKPSIAGSSSFIINRKSRS